MRPGQITPNAFEQALLAHMAERDPRIREAVRDLHVLSREFTGAGSYTTFLCEVPAEAERWHTGLNVLVTVPGVPSGLGAELFFRGARPDFLEIYTHGDELWDGVYDGFEIVVD